MLTRLLHDPAGWDSSDAERLIQAQRATLDELELRVKKEFPAEAGAIFLPIGDSFTSYSIFPAGEFSGSLVLEGDSFLGNHLSESYGIPMRFHTPSTLNDLAHRFETQGLENLLEIMSIRRPSITGAVDFRLRLNPTNPKDYIAGIIINPLNPEDGAVSREAVRFTNDDEVRVAKFLGETQRKLYEINSIKNQGERAALAEMFAVPSGYIEQPSLNGWEALSFMAQLDHPFGGDIVDAYQVGDNEAVYTSGDIVHHGLKTAQLNYNLRQRQRNFEIDGIHDPATQLEKIGLVAENAVIENVKFGMTMYMIARTRTGESGNVGLIDYAGAGCEGIIVRKSGRVEEFGGGLPIGLPGGSYTTKRKIVRPGDLVFLGTDGYDEAKDADRNMYLSHRVKGILKRNREESLRTIYEALENDVAEFTSTGRTGSHHTDDRSGTLFRFNGLN